MKSIIVSMAVAGLIAAGSAMAADCFDALAYDAALQPISEKVALGMNTRSLLFSMMANESYPTPSEQGIIYDWAIKRERCINDNTLPANPISSEGHNAIQSLILDLYKGSITYGQFARQREEVRKTVYARLQEINRQQQMQMQQYQQQQMQQQQYRQQQTQWQRQACLNRARNQIDVAGCSFEAAGASLGEVIGDMINR